MTYKEDAYEYLKPFGFSDEELDRMRKAFGKRLPDDMAMFRRLMTERGVPAEKQDEVAETLTYKFNKAHALAYAMQAELAKATREAREAGATHGEIVDFLAASISTTTTMADSMRILRRWVEAGRPAGFGYGVDALVERPPTEEYIARAAEFLKNVEGQPVFFIDSCPPGTLDYRDLRPAGEKVCRYPSEPPASVAEHFANLAKQVGSTEDVKLTGRVELREKLRAMDGADECHVREG